MIYVVYFSDGGVPKTGLSPAIVTYKKVSDGSDAASPPAVSEIGGGFYKLASTPSESLVVRVDGGAALADAYRYKVMQITPHDGDLDAQVSTRGSQTDLTAIRAKTDNLPANPAVETNVQGHVAAALNVYDPPTKAELDTAVSSLAQEANVETHVVNALGAYDPPTKAELEAAVSPLALEAGLEAHGLAALNSYDPPTRAEATADKAAIMAGIAALNDLTLGDILGGDLSDSLSFPANSLADLVRKLFWVVCNRLVITDAGGAFTAYRSDGVTPGATGTITDDGATTERSTPTWP